MTSFSAEGYAPPPAEEMVKEIVSALDREIYGNGALSGDFSPYLKEIEARGYLTGKRIIPGIKVDQGLVNFENSPEKYTQGLDGLPERLKEYYDMGARFAKRRPQRCRGRWDRQDRASPSLRAGRPFLEPFRRPA